MALVGNVSELWRYPVSSICGERIEAFTTGALGVPGDRRFGLVETATGLPVRPERDRRFHPAMALHARIDRYGATLIRSADFDWLNVLDPALPALLERHFGFAVHIGPYKNRQPPSDYDGPWAVNRYEPHALHLLTTASIARLKVLHPDGDPDRRRFRPNMLVEMAPVEGQFPEANWMGNTIRVGSVVMKMEAPTRRCGFTIIAQEGLDSDPHILRHLVRNNSHNMGIYCVFRQHGRIASGDEVFVE